MPLLIGSGGTYSAWIYVKDMKDKSVTFCFLKLKAKENVSAEN